MRDCCNFLAKKIKDLDLERKDINLLASGTAADERLNLRFQSIPVIEALRYMAEVSGTDLRIEHNALIFQPGK